MYECIYCISILESNHLDLLLLMDNWILTAKQNIKTNSNLQHISQCLSFTVYPKTNRHKKIPVSD